jgi:uncharacterized protein YjiS (DUF1127 family)
MSVLNLVFAARHALAERRKRAKAYAELMALDDRSLADIGIHRSEIEGILAGVPDCERAEARVTAPRSREVHAKVA